MKPHALYCLILWGITMVFLGCEDPMDDFVTQQNNNTTPVKTTDNISIIAYIQPTSGYYYPYYVNTNQPDGTYKGGITKNYNIKVQILNHTVVDAWAEKRKNIIIYPVHFTTEYNTNAKGKPNLKTYPTNAVRQGVPTKISLPRFYCENGCPEPLTYCSMHPDISAYICIKQYGETLYVPIEIDEY